MRDSRLYRLGGLAAIAGGALRVVNTFTNRMFESRTLNLIYLATDMLLLLGLMTWYARLRTSLGVSGIAGFVLSVAGILIVRSAALFGARGYAIGATALLLGLVVMNIPALVRHRGSIAPAILWLLSFVSGLGSLAFAPLTVLAGVLFGLGFAVAGAELWRASTATTSP